MAVTNLRRRAASGPRRGDRGGDHGPARAYARGDHVKDRVAAYKYPRIVTFTAELPKGSTGKILKCEIVVTDR